MYVRIRLHYTHMLKDKCDVISLETRKREEWHNRVSGSSPKGPFRNEEVWLEGWGEDNVKHFQTFNLSPSFYVTGFVQ